eukprot:s3161_g10.t1
MVGTDGGGPGSSASQPLLPSVSSAQPLRRRSSLSSRQRASAAELWEATLRQKLGTPGPAPPREALPSLYEHRPAVASKVAQSVVPSTVGPSASVVAWFAQYQCTKCGQVPTSLDARYCHNCGAPLPLPRVPAVVTGERSRVAINLGEVAAAAALEAIHQEASWLHVPSPTFTRRSGRWLRTGPKIHKALLQHAQRRGSTIALRSAESIEMAASDCCKPQADPSPGGRKSCRGARGKARWHIGWIIFGQGGHDLSLKCWLGDFAVSYVSLLHATTGIHLLSRKPAQDGGLVNARKTQYQAAHIVASKAPVRFLHSKILMLRSHSSTRGPRLFWRVALMAAGLFRPTMTGRKSAAALILLPCALLLIFGTWGSSAAAFLSASPAGRSALRGPQLHSMQEPRAATMCGSLPLVGLAAAVGCIVAARSTVQRRYTGSYNMDGRCCLLNDSGTSKLCPCTGHAEWLEKKTAELEELMPMTDIEFEDMVSEQTWQWARHLLPFQNRRRHEIAEFKRRCILKQPELFKKLRLWHPLALKYPTVIRRFDNLGPSDIENRDLMIDVEMLANTEKIAGFTYRDNAKLSLEAQRTESLHTPISVPWNFARGGMVFGAGQGAFAGADRGW